MDLIVGTYGQRLRLLELGIATFEVLGNSVFEAENTSCLALSPDRRFLFPYRRVVTIRASIPLKSTPMTV